MFFLLIFNSPTTKYVFTCILVCPTKLASALRSQQPPPPNFTVARQGASCNSGSPEHHVGSEAEDYESPGLGGLGESQPMAQGWWERYKAMSLLV